MANFEKALRLKVRFPFRGMCTTEDLFDLNLATLDGIYSTLCSEREEQSRYSLLEKPSGASEVLELKIEIVDYIFKTKLQEQKKRKDEASRKLQLEKLLTLRSKKQDESLLELDLDALDTLINELKEE